MTMPSSTACVSPSRTPRSMKAPGSPSSALQTMYFWSPGCLAVRLHLTPVGKPPPPRPRSPLAVTVLDHGLRRHLPEHLGQGGVAVAHDVGVDVGRVDLPAVAQHHVHLAGEERDLVEPGYVPAVVAVGEPLDDLAGGHRPGDDLGHVARLDELVEDGLGAAAVAGGLHRHHRPARAEAPAAGRAHLDVVEPALARPRAPGRRAPRRRRRRGSPCRRRRARCAPAAAAPAAAPGTSRAPPARRDEWARRQARSSSRSSPSSRPLVSNSASTAGTREPRHPGEVPPVDRHHGRERTGAQAGHRLEAEVQVGGRLARRHRQRLLHGAQHFVSAAHMTGRPLADAHRVAPPGERRELRVEGDDSEDARSRDPREPGGLGDDDLGQIAVVSLYRCRIGMRSASEWQRSATIWATADRSSGSPRPVPPSCSTAGRGTRRGISAPSGVVLL